MRHIGIDILAVYEKFQLQKVSQGSQSGGRKGLQGSRSEGPRPQEIIPLATSWRERPVEYALEVARAARKFAGISRLARVDGLSGLPFPVFSAVRPLSKIAVTISSGKGTSVAESRLSALFEAIEIAAAEVEIPTRLASTSEFSKQQIPFLSPEVLCSTDPDNAIHWCLVEEYGSGKQVLCPVAAVSMLPAELPFTPNTNGLASGTTFNEALFHGLLEVLERHAYSLALVHREGISVDLSSSRDPFLRRMLDEMKSAGLIVEVKDISKWIDIPCYYSVIYSPGELDSHLISGGIGCHLDPLIALRRTITESLQSRAVVIAGAREDITEKVRRQDEDFLESYELFRFWYERTSETIPAPDAVEPPEALAVAIDTVLDRAKRRAPELGNLYYFKFVAPPGINVVRTILPGAEVFCLDTDRMGKRVASVYAGHAVD